MSEPVLPLSAFNGAARLTDSDNVNYQTCPVCHSTRWKVYVNAKRGVWMCFAGEHSAGGRLAEGGGADDDYLRSALAGLQTDYDVEPIEYAPVDMPETKSLAESPYMLNRLREGWNLLDPAKFGICQWVSREDEGRSILRFLIPYFDKDRRIISYTGRRIFDLADSKVPKYKNPTGRRVLYNPANAWPQMRPNLCYDDTVFIVEGAFDAMRLHEHGYNALALGGKKVPYDMLHDLLTELRKYDIIVVLLDLDACNEALDLYLLLTNKLPAKSKVILGELPGKDVCALSLDRLIDGLDDILTKGLDESSIRTWHAGI